MRISEGEDKSCTVEREEVERADKNVFESTDLRFLQVIFSFVLSMYGVW